MKVMLLTWMEECALESRLDFCSARNYMLLFPIKHKSSHLMTVVPYLKQRLGEFCLPTNNDSLEQPISAVCAVMKSPRISQMQKQVSK